MADRREGAAAAARSSLAVATLLRLADADLRDATVLESGRDPGNAPGLAGRAVARMIDAVLVTELGWPGSATGDLHRVPGLNPLKRSLAAVAALLPPARVPMPLDDGGAPTAPDRRVLRESMLAARVLLKDLAGRFEVDLFGNGPAGRIEPVRPEPEPRRASASPASERTPPPFQVPAKPRQGSKPATRSSERPNTTQTIRRAKRRVEPQLAAEPREVAGRVPMEPCARHGSIASTAFWSLMDKWRVPDADALDLIGHPGGLTKKGTRPRFKLTGDEVGMIQGLQEIDATLAPLKLNVAQWLCERVREAPFEGATPLAFLVRTGIAGVREVIRFIVWHGLRMSMST